MKQEMKRRKEELYRELTRRKHCQAHRSLYTLTNGYTTGRLGVGRDDAFMVNRSEPSISPAACECARRYSSWCCWVLRSPGCRVGPSYLIGLSVNASIPSQLLFREKELNLEAQRPVRCKHRSFDVAQCLQLGIKRRLAHLEQFADTATHEYRPTVAAVGFPIGSHYRRAGQVSTAR